MNLDCLSEAMPQRLCADDEIAACLRQMIAVLERERQALASLDADELVFSAREKEMLCDALRPVGPDALDAEARGLAATARQLNEVNRRVRNLLAANVTARIEALGGTGHGMRRAYGPIALSRGKAHQ